MSATFDAVEVVAGTGGASLSDPGFLTSNDQGYHAYAKRETSVYGVVQVILKDATDTSPGSYELTFWGFSDSDPQAKAYDSYEGTCLARPFGC